MFSKDIKDGLKMGDLRITNSSIKSILKQFDYKKSILEYIWNGFDAQATCVTINFHTNDMGVIDELTIRDNGYGICKDRLHIKFEPFFDSEKVVDIAGRRNISATHGKNGVGRLTFFCFAANACWDTVYQVPQNGNNYRYQITMNDNNLVSYSETDAMLTQNSTGTEVTFTNINCILSIDEIVDQIKKEFCWYLVLNRDSNFSIIVDNHPLDYQSTIADIGNYNLEYEKSKTKFEVTYVQWKDPLPHELSKYYYIDAKGFERYKEYTSLNKKGDNFYHSVFIKSSIFDNFDFKNNDSQISFIYDRNSDEYKYIMTFVDKELKTKRKPFLKKSSEKLIVDLRNANAYPNFDEKNFIDVYRRTELDNMIITLNQAQPKIFNSLNDLQKRTFIHFLNLLMSSDEKEHLFEILDEIMDLDKDEKEDLAKLLKYSHLSNIIKTIKLIKDRYKAIDDLKNMVFNESLAANERDHLQKLIEKHYWIFGEQYHLVTAAEPDFEEALRRYTYYLSGQKAKRKIDHADKNKEMDIFAVRQDIQSKVINNIVIELKHPNVKIGMDQLNQVKTYMNVILDQPEFNAANMYWEFYLIGKDFDTSKYIENEIKSNQNHGEQSLAFKVERYKIYVKKWSELFTEFEIKHKFLNDKLELERNKISFDKASRVMDIIDNINGNTATQPDEIKVPD